MSASSASPLPPDPNLEQQKKLAKDLLRAVKQGDAAALARVREHLPDKRRITLADAHFTLAREYGFRSWAALKAHIEAQAASAADAGAIPLDELRSAFERCDAAAVQQLLEQHPAAKMKLDEPLFPFGGTALIHAASNGALDLVDVLLDAGADPNRRSDWWAGPFHPLHFAQGEIADRLIAAGAVPDAFAAANLDRIDLLRAMLAVELMLELGFDPAAPGQSGGNVLHCAAWAGSPATIAAALGHPAARVLVNRREPTYGGTPLGWCCHGAVHSGNPRAEHAEVARLLLEAGAEAGPEFAHAPVAIRAVIDAHAKGRG